MSSMGGVETKLMDDDLKVLKSICDKNQSQSINNKLGCSRVDNKFELRRKRCKLSDLHFNVYDSFIVHEQIK